MFVITPVIILLLALAGGGTAIIAKDAEEAGKPVEAKELAAGEEVPGAEPGATDSATAPRP